MKFDLHIHSKYSRDGTNEIQEIVEAAKLKNLEMIAITDHGPELSVGVDPKSIPMLISDVRESQKEKSLKILLGMEANITDRYGSIDISEEILQKLDLVVASVHYVQESATVQETAIGYIQRVTGAISKHPINVIGHPFFLHQDLFPYVSREDIEEFLELAAKKGVALELNVKYRTPNDELIKLCLQHGVKLSIGSDAHVAREVGEVEWAIKKLKKNGVRKEDLIVSYL